MPDQADTLRQLVRQAAAEFSRSEPTTRLIVVRGAKGGVGTSTVSVVLAAALARQGHASILVDADPARADATSLCGLSCRRGVAELLSGDAEATELLVDLEGGLRILPAVWSADEPPPGANTTAGRLTAALKHLGEEDAWIVVDAGNHGTPLGDRLCQQASHVVMVTTPDDLAVLDCYARIKSWHRQLSGRLGVLVNQAGGPACADDVCHRLGQACRRFLGLSLQAWGEVPTCGDLASRREGESLLALEDNAVHRAAAQVARQLTFDNEITTETQPSLATCR